MSPKRRATNPVDPVQQHLAQRAERYRARQALRDAERGQREQELAGMVRSNVRTLDDTLRGRRAIGRVSVADQPLPPVQCPGLTWHVCNRTVLPHQATDMTRTTPERRATWGVVGDMLCDACRELLVTVRVERVEFYRALGANAATLAQVRAHDRQRRSDLQGE